MEKIHSERIHSGKPELTAARASAHKSAESRPCVAIGGCTTILMPLARRIGKRDETGIAYCVFTIEIGTTGTPAVAAILNGPALNWPSTPVGLRVPSGNVTCASVRGAPRARLGESAGERASAPTCAVRTRARTHEVVAVLEARHRVTEGGQLALPVGAAQRDMPRELHGPADQRNAQDLDL